MSAGAAAPGVLQGFPLSPQQRHLWRLAAAGSAGAYRVEGRIEIAGPLEVGRLRQALARVVERHEILRTDFRCLPGMTVPLQVVGEGGPAWRGERDLRALAPAEREAAAAVLLAELAPPSGQPEPPLAALLAATGPDRHLLLLRLSALCADAGTLDNLVSELGRAYAAEGGTSDTEPLQYADFAAWQNDLLDAAETEAAREQWRRLDLETLAEVRLPFATGPAPEGEFAPRALPVDLPVPDGAPPAAFALACWQALLWRLTGAPEVAVAAFCDGRDLEELEGALGPVGKHLPIAAKIEEGDRFAQVVRRAGRALDRARAGQAGFAWERTAAPEAAAGEEAAAPWPAFAFTPAGPPASWSGAGVRFELAGSRAFGERFVLQLACGPAGAAELQYDASRVAPGDAERLAGWLGTLARDAAARGDAYAGELALLTPAETAELSARREAARLELPVRCLHELVAEQAARTPERVAVRAEEGSLTYAALAARAGRLARRLAALGVGPEAPVALHLERPLDRLVALLAVLEAGGAWVPLDPDHPVERLAGILAEVRPRVVLTGERLEAALPPVPGAVVLPIEERGGPEADPLPAGPGNLAYAIYTSGSTGRPKGVMQSHGAIANRLLWMQREHPLEAADRVLQKTPYGFDASIWELFCPLFAGAALVLARPGGHQDSAYLARTAAEEGITVLQLVPSQLGPFLDEPAAAGCAALRRLFCGGEELPAGLAERFYTRFPAAGLHNLYGPTEAAIDATSWSCHRGEPRIPIGRPIANVEVQLLYARAVPVPDGVTGELAIGGTGLARGYLGRPEQTAERFVPHPFPARAGDRLYRTGDLAQRRGDGAIEYLGRLDRQVKVRGVRIELAEVEARLLALPGVRQAVVQALPEAGGEGSRLVAWVVPDSLGTSPGNTPGEALRMPDLRRALRDLLPAAMVPAAFVPLRALPLTPNGKLDRRALPPPDDAHPEREGELVLPRTPTEELLAGVWAEVLEVERVGVHDNFFDLGGHSLRATQLVSRLRRLFGVELPLRDLFREPTVAALARRVEALERGGPEATAPPLVPVPRSGRLPLSFAQQRLWFLEQLKPGTALYNISDAVRFRGALDVAALAATLAEVVRRHEALRTTFPAVRGEAVQAIGPALPPPLPLVDLGALPEPARRQESSRVIVAEGERPFDLARGPLFRVLLLRLAVEEHVAATTVHHIVSDAWSTGVLVREIAALYPAALAGAPSPLPEPPVQYADFAHWQRSRLRGEVLEAELAYWRRRLAGAPALLALPSDRPRPETPSLAGATRPVLLPAPVADALRSLARREGATLFMVLLAAFKVLLRHHARQDDLVVGTDVANRNREETEGLIGFFINQLVLRSHLGGDPPFTELLRQVRETTLGAYAHQDLPFDTLVDALRLERTLSHAPLFQVKLFLENTPARPLALPGLALEPLDLEVRVAKLDLTLALWERPEGLSGWINYRTDLFDAPRIERLMRQLATLAGAIAALPEARLSALDEVLTDMERKEQEMEKRELRDFSFKKFKAMQPKAVALPRTEVVERGELAPGQALPLVIRPAVEDVDLAEWAAANRESLEEDLLRHGAVLFRGFGIDTPETFERFARTLCPDLFNENGEHPRESVSGNVYTPVFYPQDQQLLWHNENSFNWSWPRKIFFCCAKPADAGGETPIVDSRRVCEEVAPEVRAAFAERGVLYQRNYAPGLGLPWQTVFQTDDRAAVEAECRETHVELDWREGDRLRTRARRPGVVRHPRTGEPTWFNQAQHWHVSCLDPETRRSMRELFADGDLPRHCYYGDGGELPDEHMRAVLDAYARLEVAFPWQRGDVLMLDNLLTAHGRNPFRGERKILVAMGEMTTYDDVEEAR